MIEGRQFAVCQSQGARDYQEDSAEFSSLQGEDGDGLLMVLADGMGGHRGGAHASRVAIATFVETFAREGGSIGERLDRALHEANEQIGEDGKANPELEGMGCTLIGAMLTKSGLEWISVGDSPMWLVRGGRLQRLNEDHSMAPILAKQVELGEMTVEEAAHHPQRNALRSAVIGDTMQHIDQSKQPVRFRKGDYLLIASDGVETLSVDDIAALFGESKDADAETLARNLVVAVDGVQRKGQDNTTVMVVDLFFGGKAAFGAVDPEAQTERVTRRTITPIRKPEKKKNRGLGKAAMVLVLALLIAGAAAGWIYRDEVKKLVGWGENAAVGSGAGSSGVGTKSATPKTKSKPGNAPGSKVKPKTTSGPRGEAPKSGGGNSIDSPPGTGTKKPAQGGGETALNPDPKKPASGSPGAGAGGGGEKGPKPGSSSGN
ncbi:MAG: PP2C family protein-serine/threonine phosphatase [Alphaproteobacteria bacterium]